MRQRFRWSFGILQAIFKHRGAISKHAPWACSHCPISLSSDTSAMVSPLIDLMFFRWGLHYFVDKALSSRALRLTASTSCSASSALPAHRLRRIRPRFAPGAEASGQQRRCLATGPHLDSTLYLHDTLFCRAVQAVKRAIDGKPSTGISSDRTAKMSKATES